MCTQRQSGSSQHGLLLRPRAWVPVLRPLAGALSSLRFRIQISLGGNTTSPGPARGKRGFQAASWEKSVCSGESSQAPAGTFRCLLRDLNSLGNSTLSLGSAGGKLCTRGHLGRGSLHW